MVEFLASVADPAEAKLALDAGADVIDAKDPALGALGALAPARVAAIRDCVAGRRQVSAVAGAPGMSPDELARAAEEMAATGIDMVKVGLATATDRCAAIDALGEVAGRGARVVALFFADEPFELELVDAAATAGLHGVMWDTADKAAGSLTDCRPDQEIAAFVRRARAAGLRIGLAGSLGLDDIDRLAPVGPDLLGFRGALCLGDRAGTINPVACQAVRARLDRALDLARERIAAGAEVVPVPQRATGGGRGFGRQREKVLAARFLSRSAAGRDAERDPLDRIFVRDFELPCRIGVYEEEQGKTQQVRFDVEAHVVPNDAYRDDDFDRVFSYDNITDAIREVIDEGHIGLVETVAERVAERCLAYRQVARVTVRVEKLERDPGGVGIEITRTARRRPGSDLLHFPTGDDLR